MRSVLVSVLPYALAVTSGALYALAFAPYDVRPLGWLALWPLLEALRRTGTWRRALLVSMLMGGTACALGYGWIGNVAQLFWQTNAFLTGLMVLAYALIGELNFTIFGVVVWRFRKALWAGPAVILATIFTGIEMLVVKIFPDALAHTLLGVGSLPAVSALIGLHGLSFLVAWFSVSLAFLVHERRKRNPWRLVELGLCLVVLAGAWLYGFDRQRRMDARPSAGQMDLLLLQPNVGDPVGFVQGDTEGLRLDSLVTLYIDATKEALRERTVDYIIWPETAVPTDARNRVVNRIRELAITTQSSVLWGGYDFIPKPGDEEDDWLIYNALFWIDADGVLRDRYYKNKLIPLGEFVPLSGFFPFLLDILPETGQFSRGEGPRFMQVNDERFAPLICYEILFPRYVRRAVKAGGEVILNITNDYWFGRFAEPEQHLALARMRAYETERPIVRATNTGISAIIDPKARVTHRTPLWQPATLVVTLDVPEMYETPYVRYGLWLSLAFMALCTSVTLLAWRLFANGGRQRR